MRHLSDGALRRIYDEPLALTATDQAHYETCAECKTRFQMIASTARATTALLDVPAFAPEPVGAFRSVQDRIQREEAARPPRWYERWRDRTTLRWRPLATPAIIVLLAAALATGLAVSGAAGSLIRVFEPHSIVAVQVSPSDFAGSGAVLDYGEVTWLPAAPKPELLSDAAAAHARSGLPVLTPASLPKGVSGPVSFGVVSDCRFHGRDRGPARGLPPVAAGRATGHRGSAAGHQRPDVDASDPDPKGSGDHGTGAGQRRVRAADQGGHWGGRGLGEEWRNLRRRRPTHSRPGARHCNNPPLIAS